MITDACPQCEADHLDLQALTFSKVGASAGFAACPATAVWAAPLPALPLNPAVLLPGRGTWYPARLSQLLHIRGTGCPLEESCSTTTEAVIQMGFCEQH